MEESRNREQTLLSGEGPQPNCPQFTYLAKKIAPRNATRKYRRD
jgi:hypothetical protein